MEIIWLGNLLGYGTSFFGNVYGVGGVAPCIQSRDYKGPRLVLIETNEQRRANRNDKEIWEQK
jgi:predicted ATP-dependent protease